MFERTEHNGSIIAGADYWSVEYTNTRKVSQCAYVSSYGFHQQQPQWYNIFVRLNRASPLFPMLDHFRMKPRRRKSYGEKEFLTNCFQDIFDDRLGLSTSHKEVFCYFLKKLLLIHPELENVVTEICQKNNVSLDDACEKLPAWYFEKQTYMPYCMNTTKNAVIRHTGFRFDKKNRLVAFFKFPIVHQSEDALKKIKADPRVAKMDPKDWGGEIEVKLPREDCYNQVKILLEAMRSVEPHMEEGEELMMSYVGKLLESPESMEVLPSRFWSKPVSCENTKRSLFKAAFCS